MKPPQLHFSEVYNDHECILVPFSQYVLGYKQFYSLRLHIVNRNESLQMISYYYWEINFLSPGSPESISQIPVVHGLCFWGILVSTCKILQGPSPHGAQRAEEGRHHSLSLKLATDKMVWNCLITSFYLSSDLFIPFGSCALLSYSDEHTNEILRLFYSCCEIIEMKDQTSA